MQLPRTDTLPHPSTNNTFIIVSDSLSSLNAISHPSPSHPLISRIHLHLNTCAATYISIVFVWVPGHADNPGNEKVYKAAKLVTRLPSVSKSSLPSNSDLFLYINNVIRQQWSTKWRNLHTQGNKLAQLKEVPTQWPSSNQPTRSQEIILTRLRIGHTRLTHTHLISHLMPLSCPHCN